MKYPIGEQDFRNIRESGCVYVDKTLFLERIIRSGGKYFFLARPRRFGKSLFLSTIDYFFRGERELFRGLHADTMQWDWAQYPILRLDLNVSRYEEPGMLDRVMDNVFRKWEEKYDVGMIAGDMSSRFQNIIEAAHVKTGRQVVILVDEYDKPLVGNLNKDELFKHYRAKLAGVYANFKSSAEHIRLVFMTGVSRFSKLSVFSDLNNIRDITFLDEYADICGITEREMTCDLGEGIRKLAEKNGKSFEEAHATLKANYDGYRFATKGSEIYNPWSLLNALANGAVGEYWNETGIPTVAAEALKRIDADLEESFDIECEESELKGMDLTNPNPTALLYQTGYLTIKDYDRELSLYRLGIPNREVKKGFFNVLLPYYGDCRDRSMSSVVREIIAAIRRGQPEKFMRLLQTFFAGVSYKMRMENESNFHNAFYLLMSLIGMDTETEVDTSDVRIDLLIKTRRFIYIIELKYDGSSQDALDQIRQKQYDRPYRSDSRKVFLIGVNFSSATRTIEDWKIICDA